MRLIDADALKRKAQKVATEAWKMRIKSSVETILNQFIDWIDNAPTIEERKKGRWKFEDKYVNRDDDTIEIRRCSNCGFKHYYCQGNTTLNDDAWFNFCPNCGSYNGGGGDD